MRVVATALDLLLDREVKAASLLIANSSRNALYGALVAMARRVPLVVHLRDRVEKPFLGTFGYFAMTRLVLPVAAGVVSNSEATLVTARPFLRTSTATVVAPSPIGWSGPELHPKVLQEASRPLVVGMIARLAPWKGQDLLIRAFASAFPAEDSVLRLVGGTSFGGEQFEKELRELAAELGVQHRVQLTGHVDDPLIAARSLDICVQYSVRPEPLGQNVLQYLALGKALLVADEGGPAEWVNDRVNGLKVRPRDSEALAAALRLLVGDPALLEEIRRGARETQVPTDEQVASVLENFYRKVALGGPSN